jgi:hypothetical protein
MGLWAQSLEREREREREKKEERKMGGWDGGEKGKAKAVSKLIFTTSFLVLMQVPNLNHIYSVSQALYRKCCKPLVQQTYHTWASWERCQYWFIPNSLTLSKPQFLY